MKAALDAERMKARRSWHLLAALLGPLCQTGLLALVCWHAVDRMRAFLPGFRFWLALNFAAWNLLVMPALAALVCDLNWELEREAGPIGAPGAQPVSTQAHYLAKALVNLGLLGGATLLQGLLAQFLGLLLSWNPELSMGPWPWDLGWRHLVWSLLALPAVVTFQTGFSRAIGGWSALGIALVGAGITHRLSDPPILLALSPWGLASRAALAFDRGRHLPWAWVPLSLILALLLTQLGARWETRRWIGPE